MAMVLIAGSDAVPRKAGHHRGRRFGGAPLILCKPKGHIPSIVACAMRDARRNRLGARQPMRGILAGTAMVLAIAGCTKADWGIPPSAEEIAAADEAKCATYGYPVDHPEHGLCRMLLAQQRAETELARRTAVMANPGLPLARAALLQQAIQPPVAPIPPQGFTCFPAGGNTVTCR